MRKWTVPVIMSGGAAPLTPAQFGSQTGHWDASKWATSFYTDAGSTLATAENDAIWRIGDISGNGRYLDKEGSTEGQLKLNIQNGLAGLYRVNGMSYLSAAGVLLSNFFTVSLKCAFIVVKNFTSATDNTTVYINSPLLVSAGGFWGVTVGTSGPIRHYNYGGGEATGTETLANNVVKVITVWHTGGTLYLQKNLGTVYSVASGNTTNLTHQLGLFGGYSSYRSGGYFLEASVHNAYAGDSQRTSVITGLMTKWGIT